MINNGVSTAVFSSSSSTTDIIVAVKQTLALWCIAVDSKAYSTLSQAFTSDVNAKVAPFDITNLTALSDFYETAFEGQITLHEDNTFFVEVQNTTSAKATHYSEAVYFGQGNLTGQIATFYEIYVDFLRPEEGTWKIYDRSLNFIVSAPVRFISSLMFRIVIEVA